MDRLMAAVIAAFSGVIGAGLWLNNVDQPGQAAADRSMGTDAAEMTVLNDEFPTAPLALPEVLPRGYGWAGVGEVQGDGQLVWARTSQFTSVNGDPVVEVCVKGVRERRGCEDDGDPTIERAWDGHRVVVSFSAGQEEQIDSKLLTFWKDVELTNDYRDVRWLEI